MSMNIDAVSEPERERKLMASPSPTLWSHRDFEVSVLDNLLCG